jgi:hypothetical protein
MDQHNFVGFEPERYPEPADQDLDLEPYPDLYPFKKKSTYKLYFLYTVSVHSDTYDTNEKDKTI